MNSAVLFAVIFVVLIPQLNARATWGTTSGQWQDCSNPASPVHLTHLSIEPNPVVMPGNMLFSMEGYTNRTLGTSTLRLSIIREGRWFNIPIPCIRNIGSCTYDDMCTMLDDMINEDWLHITRDLGRDIKRMLRRNGMRPGLCPQPPQSISIDRNSLRLPRMPAALNWFAAGTYSANVRVIDNTNQEELVCFDVRIAVEQGEEDCSGFWGCIFS